MATLIKYSKKNESYSPYQVHNHKIYKYHLSHEKFVVPWQMDDEKQVKEKGEINSF